MSLESYADDLIGLTEINIKREYIISVISNKQVVEKVDLIHLLKMV